MPIDQALIEKLNNEAPKHAYSVIVTTYFGNLDSRNYTCVVMAQNMKLAEHYAILQVAKNTDSLVWTDGGEVQEDDGEFAYRAIATPLESFECDIEELTQVGNYIEHKNNANNLLLVQKHLTK